MTTIKKGYLISYNGFFLVTGKSLSFIFKYDKTPSFLTDNFQIQYFILRWVFQWDISHRIIEYQNWLGPKRPSSPVLLNYFKPAELWIFSPKRHLAPKPHIWKTMVLLLLKAGWSAGPIPQWPVVPKQQHPKAPLGQLLPALTKEQETWTQEMPLTVRVTLQVWFTDSLSVISC